MKTMRSIAAVGVLLFTSTACLGSFDIENNDDASVELLEQNPTASVIAATAQGLLQGFRSGVENKLQTLSHYAREGYYVAVARTVLDEFDEPLVPANGIGWSTTYTFIRTSNTLLSAIDAVELIPEPDKEALRGWAKTMEAFLLHGQIRVQDEFGIAVDTDRERDEPLAPIVSKADAFTFILQRYDEAAAHLQNAGSEFPFELSPGFDGFDTPMTFLMVNRALKARAAIEVNDYAAALAALLESFLDTGGDLRGGAFNTYSTAVGDALNRFNDPSGFQYLLDTNLVVDAQFNAASEIDRRITDKTFPTAYITHTGVTSNLGNNVYPENDSPLAIIKNDELILIRAEARMFTGDRPGALADINVIRVIAGGLDPLAVDPGDPGLEDELLYNRRYSLFFEFGHRWVDLRRFGRLLDFVGPRGAGDRIFDKVPLPSAECEQRNNEPAGCVQVDGIRTIN